jgi:hypothetical protein
MHEMKKLILAVATASLLIPLSQGSAQDGSNSQSAKAMSFVGFSDESQSALKDVTDGRWPISALHELCRDDFGPTARMCTTREFVQSPERRGSSTPSWIIPHLVMESGAGSDQLYCGEASGAGLVVLTNGRLHEGLCDVARPVTCCAPAP